MLTSVNRVTQMSNFCFPEAYPDNQTVIFLLEISKRPRLLVYQFRQVSEQARRSCWDYGSSKPVVLAQSSFEILFIAFSLQILWQMCSVCLCC